MGWGECSEEEEKGKEEELEDAVPRLMKQTIWNWKDNLMRTMIHRKGIVDVVTNQRYDNIAKCKLTKNEVLPFG